MFCNNQKCDRWLMCVPLIHVTLSFRVLFSVFFFFLVLKNISLSLVNAYFPMAFTYYVYFWFHSVESCNVLWVKRDIYCARIIRSIPSSSPSPEYCNYLPTIGVSFFFSIFSMCSVFCVLSLENNYGHYNFYLPPSV